MIIFTVKLFLYVANLHIKYDQLHAKKSYVNNFAVTSSISSYRTYYVSMYRFTSDVKIKSISIVSGAYGTSPSKMRV